MSEIKFCKDCRNFLQIEGLETGYCLLRYELFKSAITNKTEKLYQYNFIERDFGSCGPEAKYFEPRKTFLQRLKEWVRC